MTSKPISESGELLLSSAALMWLIVKDQSNGRLEDASFTLLVKYWAVGQMRFITNLVVSLK